MQNNYYAQYDTTAQYETPITNQQDGHDRWPTRQEVLKQCLGLQDSPKKVRDWFKTYLEYRGLDAINADKFFWREEPHRATYSNLLEAFKQHCGKLDWEADVLAYDVYTVVEGSIPPPERTMFQKYVEGLFGYEFYINLMQWTKPNPGFLDRANCIFCWLGLLSIHGVLTLIGVVITAFLLST
ncbi:Uu.00g145090.m01.CDS01 [Anthostomella pinea]|uniref:Uu.00g145090.m01.CDS01 n=1 Tax=Anthostomella pinea TaxID=933095 RepID=A0AAI8YLP9_9PEZI|nr:Uu.00g145090.m01.CDS01 [Anthostomella pinea]